MRTVYRALVLAIGLLPPLVYVVIQELGTANLVDLCEFGCGSVWSSLDLLSIIAYLLFTPGFLILFLGSLEKRETGTRTAGLAILLLSFYGLFFFGSGSGLFAGGNEYVQPLLLLLPATLMMGLGYLVATARTAKVIVIVFLAALLGTGLLLVAGYPHPIIGTQYSCSQTEVVNASSPFPVYIDVCTPYSVALPGPGLASDYVVWLTIFAAIAAIADAVFIQSYRPQQQC